VFEVPERQLPDAQALIKVTMERAAALSVPLVVEVGHGASWEKAH
jgi:DNA polymerase-1